MDASQFNKIRLDEDKAASFRNQQITRLTILHIRKIYGTCIHAEVQNSIDALGKGELNYKRCKALQVFIKDYCLTVDKQQRPTVEVVIAVDDIIKKKNLKGKKLGLLINQKKASITILSISQRANEAIAQSVIDFEIPPSHLSVHQYRPVKEESCCVLY